MLHTETKQKRNKPCENCRAHRRKCIVTDKTICERCLRMSIPCLFKFSTKPIIPKKSISTSKKNRLLQKVWSLEKDAKMLEAEFEHYSQIHQQQLLQLQKQREQQEKLHQQQHPTWNLSLQKLKNGFQLNTNITSVHDLLLFLQQSSHFFQPHDYLSPSSSTSIPSFITQSRPITITIRATPMENALRNMFSLITKSKSSSLPSSPSTQLINNNNNNNNNNNKHFSSNVSLSSNSSTSSLCLSPPVITSSNHHHPSPQPTQSSSSLSTTTNNNHNNNNNNNNNLSNHIPSVSASPVVLVNSILDHQQHSHFLAVKRYMIDLYFNCGHLYNPILIQPYFQPYMQEHLDDMMSWIVVAYVAYSPCQHVNPQVFEGLPWSRQELGEICRTEARRLLEDALFDCEGNDQLSISWMFTSHLLTQCAFFTLQNKSAKVYADSAWHLAVVLKEIYVPVLRKNHQQQQELKQKEKDQLNQQKQHPHYYYNHPHSHQPSFQFNHLKEEDDEIQLIFAETWRRLYYATRYYIIALNIVNNTVSEIPQMAIHMKDIGLPEPLYPYEQQGDFNHHYKELNESVLAYHFITQLDHEVYFSCNSKITSMRYELYTGKMESITADELLSLENRLMDYWHGLPEQYRLSSSPIDYIQMDRVHQCTSVRFLRVNINYYMCWLSNTSRIMTDPSRSDLSNVSFNNINGERSILIVSMCCDALVKIFHVLYLKLPCTVEVHWIVIVLDSILLLLKSKNNQVKQRAEQNIRMAKHVYQQIMENSYQNLSKSSSSSSENDSSFHPFIINNNSNSNNNNYSLSNTMNNQSYLHLLHHHQPQQSLLFQQQTQSFQFPQQQNQNYIMFQQQQQQQSLQPMDDDQMTHTVSTATYSSTGSNTSMILDTQHPSHHPPSQQQNNNNINHNNNGLPSSSFTIGSSASCASPCVSQDTYMTMDSNDLNNPSSSSDQLVYTNEDIVQKSALYGSCFQAIKKEMDAQLATQSN
ncbi:unnamed protein product [Cunninghamella blakesleeana]